MWFLIKHATYTALLLKCVVFYTYIVTGFDPGCCTINNNNNNNNKWPSIWNLTGRYEIPVWIDPLLIVKDGKSGFQVPWRSGDATGPEIQH